jgi:hypothetical protein
MRLVVTVILSAALVFALRPTLAQSPGAATMPPGTQNPALVQPQMTPPVRLMPQSQPIVIPPAGAPQPGSAPTPSLPSALIAPDSTDSTGLCECLVNHGTKTSVLDKSKMHRHCVSSPEACQQECQTDRYFSFVPHATGTCPSPPGPAAGHIAMNDRPALLLSSRR